MWFTVERDKRERKRERERERQRERERERERENKEGRMMGLTVESAAGSLLIAVTVYDTTDPLAANGRRRRPLL